MQIVHGDENHSFDRSIMKEWLPTAIITIEKGKITASLDKGMIVIVLHDGERKVFKS